MTQSSRTATPVDSPPPAKSGDVADALELELEEPEQALLRRGLGLRPVHYAAEGPHPDRRACPPWCWAEGTDEEHDIDHRQLFSASHTYGPTLSVAAGVYDGERFTDKTGPAMIRPATIETSLTQRGQNRPLIRVHLRHWPRDKFAYEERLTLLVDDARDLVRVLQYLIDVADGEVAR